MDRGLCILIVPELSPGRTAVYYEINTASRVGRWEKAKRDMNECEHSFSGTSGAQVVSLPYC
jgi:hypothetical protein